MRAKDSVRIARAALHVLFALFILLGALPFAFSAPARVFAQPGVEVFINEIHYDNSGTDSGEAIEIAGPSGTDISGYQIILYNGSNSLPYGTTVIPAATVLPNTCGGLGVYVLNYPVNGLQNGAPDGMALVDGTGTLVQFLSYEGTITGLAGPTIGVTSVDIGVSEDSSTLAGSSLQLGGTGQYYADFSWQTPATATFGACNTGQTYNPSAGDSAPAVSSITPADGANNVPVDTTIAVTFSEPVNLADGWFQIACTTSAPVTVANATVSGGPTTFTIDPDTDFAYEEDCTLTVNAPAVADQDTDDPPDVMAANVTASFSVAADLCTTMTNYIPIYDIQGSGLSTPLGSFPANEDVLTRGVVTADLQDEDRNGFFLQDPTGDLDPATSDGVFVYENNRTEIVNVGDVVAVIGDVTEFFDLTEVSAKHYDADHAIVVCGTGSVGSTTVNVPIPDSVPDRDSFWEPFEGMYITIPQELTVTDVYELGRYGNVILSTGGRLENFTQVNAPSVAGFQDHVDNLFRNQVYLDDHSNDQNPDPVIFPDPGLAGGNNLRAGSTISGLTGVLNYTFGEYRIEPVNPFLFDLSANPRPAAPPAVGGTLTAASFNVLNFFVTLDQQEGGCGPDFSLDCRGADTLDEYNRQLAKAVAALVKLDADVIGLAEIENHATDDAVTALLAALNAAAGAGTYDAISTGPIGTDAIKVAIFYKPGVVTPLGAHQVLTYDGDAINNYRPSLAQTFEQNATGEVFTMVMNHFKSKGCSDAAGLDLDQDDGQGCYNFTRRAAAQQLASWLATDPTGSGDPDFLIMGDLNVYAQEDPLVQLEVSGFADLIEQYVGYLDSAYSYSFFGEWGTLDYAFASADLTGQVTGAAEWHINSDEAPAFDYNNYNQASLFAADEFRSADHDPILVGLALTTVLPAGPGYQGEWSPEAAGSVDPITGLPATGYPPAGDAPDGSVPGWLVAALLAVVALAVVGLVIGGRTLRRRMR